jgi:hypothetical protein
VYPDFFTSREYVMSFRTSFAILVSGALAMVTPRPGELGARPPLQATDTDSHCGLGEATAALQALEVGFTRWNPFEGELGENGLGAWSSCQYRLWTPVSPVTGEAWEFCEHDVFLAGSAFALIGADGVAFCGLTNAPCAEDADCPIPGEWCIDSHPKATAGLDRITETAQFGPSVSALESQELTRTATKTVVGDGLTIVWFQDGFILQRPPGTYVSRLQAFHDGVLFEDMIVPVEVVSHEVHLARVADGTWK